MSVRAYFLKTVVYDEEPTFNLWRNADFFDIFYDYCHQEMNEDCSGMIEISIENWETMKEEEDLEAFKDIVERIDKLFERTDCDDAIAGEYVRFYCI